MVKLCCGEESNPTWSVPASGGASATTSYFREQCPDEFNTMQSPGGAAYLCGQPNGESSGTCRGDRFRKCQQGAELNDCPSEGPYVQACENEGRLKCE